MKPAQGPAAMLQFLRLLVLALFCAWTPLARAQEIGVPAPSEQPAAEQPPAVQAAEAASDAAQAAAKAAEAAANAADPYAFLGIPLLAWSMAIGFSILSFALLVIVRGILRSRAEAFAKARPNPVTQGLAHLVASTNILVLLVVAFAIGAIQLPLPAKGEHAVRIAVIIALSIQSILWGMVLIDIGLKRLIASKTTADGKPDPTLLSAMIPLKFICTLVLVAIIALIALDNAGIDVTAMVAGLGIGGIAIALAVQSILGDLFSAVSIVIDKPFVVGDFIVVGDKMGTVETIGLKTTRLRALSGEQLVFANSDLLSSRIQNFKRMVERRVVITIGVTYQTTPSQLRSIPPIVRQAVERQRPTRFDRCHLVKLADSSLAFELVYFVLDADFNKHADIQQEVLLEIIERFNEAAIDFAYPTQTVFEHRVRTITPDFKPFPAIPSQPGQSYPSAADAASDAMGDDA